jgi:hypothetical protein
MCAVAGGAMQTESGNVPVARIKITTLKLLIRIKSAKMMGYMSEKCTDEFKGNVLICS